MLLDLAASGWLDVIVYICVHAASGWLHVFYLYIDMFLLGDVHT